MGSIMIELKGKLIYKSNILFTMFAALASILVQIALWQYLYQGRCCDDGVYDGVCYLRKRKVQCTRGTNKIKKK